MRILVTAFDPFGGDSANVSEMVLNALPDKVGEVIIDKLLVNTIYIECGKKAFAEAVKNGDCAVLAMGQAGGRNGVSMEAVAINYALASIADNNGLTLRGEKLYNEEKSAYFSTLPVKEIVEAIEKKGFKSFLSCSAGGFVCNSMLYTLLMLAEKEEKDIRCGFMHLPYADVQNKDGFSMTIDELVESVIEAVRVIESNIERNNV